MKRGRFTTGQGRGFQREAEAALPVKELYRKHASARPRTICG